jgi:AI-2 transport protein TqsA
VSDERARAGGGASEGSPERRIQTVCLLLLTAIAIGAALYYLRPVVIPFVLAVFFAYGLSPAVDFQVRALRLPRALALVATLLAGCALLVLFGLLVRRTALQISENAPVYGEQLQAIVDKVSAKLPLARLGVDAKEIGPLLSASRESVRDAAGTLIGSVMAALSSGILVLLFLLFLMVGQPNPGAPRESLRAEIESSVKRYIVAKVLLSALTGALVGAALALLGVRFALVFGVLAFLLNFIPNLGSVVSTLLPAPVVLLDPELSLLAKILAFAIPAAIQFVVGNIVEAKVLGGSLGLHPITILLGLVFFGMIWGIVGMLLAAPILAVLKIVLGRIPFTSAAGRVLEGKLGADRREERR